MPLFNPAIPGITTVPAAGVAWITADGSDATGQVGNAAKPFLTIQAAYDAGARNFVCLNVAAGDLVLTDGSTLNFAGINSNVGTISCPSDLVSGLTLNGCANGVTIHSVYMLLGEAPVALNDIHLDSFVVVIGALTLNRCHSAWYVMSESDIEVNDSYIHGDAGTGVQSFSGSVIIKNSEVEDGATVSGADVTATSSTTGDISATGDVTITNGTTGTIYTQAGVTITSSVTDDITALAAIVIEAGSRVRTVTSFNVGTTITMSTATSLDTFFGTNHIVGSVIAGVFTP